MNDAIRRALETDEIVDIITTGRKTGTPRRIEIMFQNLDGDCFLTGTPTGKRNWYANLLAHPDFTLCLKRSTQADIPAHATPIVDEVQRRAVFERMVSKWEWDEHRRSRELEDWVQASRLVRVDLDLPATGQPPTD